ncbi:MAG: threonine aldolase [Saprospiraceae bacterium]|nr:threonine aldolase [Saprospiraceae bacterium]
MINLLSDTVTKPTPGMLRAMWAAEVGDDVFREDPTVNALEAYVAELTGHEAALFCPSGTMANQIALKVHTRPMDEVICDETSHIFQYEVGGYAFHSGIGVNLLRSPNGILEAEQIGAAVKPLYDWLPRSTLCVIENTNNKGGGGCYSLEGLQSIGAMCRDKNLALHLDGARLFNAVVARGYTPRQVGACVDSASLCLSKGLGAPMGTVLTGNAKFIAEARRVRKAMGGGMRQVGYMAAAGLYALQNQVERLEEDHRHARQLAETLVELPWVEGLRPVETNIVIFDLKAPLTPAVFLEKLAEKGIKASAFGPQAIRFVTHLDVPGAMINQTVEVLRRMTF